jgi:hypothetical protein
MAEDPAVQELIDKIRVYRAKGQFDFAKEFINGISKKDRERKSVAIEIAQLYLVQGYFKLAEQACVEAGGSMFSNDKVECLPKEAYDEESVAFELLRAFIWIGRYSMLFTALDIAKQIGTICKFPSCMSISETLHHASFYTKAVVVDQSSSPNASIAGFLLEHEPLLPGIKTMHVTNRIQAVDTYSEHRASYGLSSTWYDQPLTWNRYLQNFITGRY